MRQIFATFRSARLNHFWRVPSFQRGDCRNVGLRDFIFFSKHLMGVNSFLKLLPNFYDLIRAKLSRSMNIKIFRGVCLTTFLNHILRVFLMRSNPQVSRSDAGFIITFMKHTKSVRYWAYKQSVRNSVSHGVFSSKEQGPISTIANPPGPFPASFLSKIDLYLREKSFHLIIFIHRYYAVINYKESCQWL
jgi:hypothetical protein